MASFDDQLSEIHPKTPAQWRSWLLEHHAEAQGVWLVYFRESTGQRELSWEEAVREALCFGWIDSKVQGIDDERYRQTFTPRKPNSVWSKVNKQHVAELSDAGLMTEAGQRVIDIARKNGSWSILEPVDDLIVPPELAAAFAQAPGTRASYEALSNGAKRTILYSLYTAKRDETRAKRAAQAVASLNPQG